MDQIIKIRVHAVDKTAIETAAAAQGLSVSAWARNVLWDATNPDEMATQARLFAYIQWYGDAAQKKIYKRRKK